MSEVSVASLTFTSGNWDTPQTVTITGLQDYTNDCNVGYTIVTGAASSADGNYNGLNASDVSVTNTDNDTAGITVSSVSGPTTEGGGTATFTIVLNTQPTANVTITLSSSDASEGSVEQRVKPAELAQVQKLRQQSLQPEPDQQGKEVHQQTPPCMQPMSYPRFTRSSWPASRPQSKAGPGSDLRSGAMSLWPTTGARCNDG